MHIASNIPEDNARMSIAFQAVGLFLYEFSQLEFTMRGLLSGFANSNKKQPPMSPDNFLNLCTEAQGFFAKKSSDQDELKKLFDKCRELNDARMIIVQGFMTDGNGSIAPQFASSNLEKAYRYFINPEELVELANTARIISDKFIEEVLI